MQYAKPPLGVMPENIWKENRIEELHQAIDRYKSFYGQDTEKTDAWEVELQRLEVETTNNIGEPTHG